MTIPEFLVMVMVFDESRTEAAIVEAVTSIPYESRGELEINASDVPAILVRLQELGYVERQDDLYHPTNAGPLAAQDQVDAMRCAVGFAMQTGHFFT